MDVQQWIVHFLEPVLHECFSADVREEFVVEVTWIADIERIAGQVISQAVAERVRADDPFQHAQDTRPFRVRDRIEQTRDVRWTGDVLHDDRMRRRFSVIPHDGNDFFGQRLYLLVVSRRETKISRRNVPENGFVYHVPIGIVGCERLVREPGCHGLVQPKVVPPFARDIVSEPCAQRCPRK